MRLVFLGADCMVTDCKRILKQRLHYFSGSNLFWKVLDFLFVISVFLVGRLLLFDFLL